MRFGSTLFALAVIVAAAGCSKQFPIIQGANLAPAVRLTGSVIDRSATGAFRYSMRWSGEDADGRVAHYLYALDPRSIDRVDASWQRISDVARTVVFSGPESGGGAGRSHVFVVRAVDDRGEMSDPQWVAYVGDSIPPRAIITNPIPSSLNTPTLGPSARFTWAGDDPDAKFTTGPIRYKYALFNPSSFVDGRSFHPDSIALDPGRIDRLLAPTFPGWDSTSAETTTVQFTNLPPNQTYLFAVVAFDETGLYTMTHSLNANLLRFRVGVAKVLGPEVSASTEGFHYTFRRGYFNDPTQYARVQLPSGRPIELQWSAIPSPGTTLTGYRWALDPVDPYDDTPRSSGADLGRWSTPSLTTTSVTLGPYTGGVKGETHRLFIEARDNADLRTLAVIEFTVLPFHPTRSVLIVDDTRLRVDAVDPNNPGCVRSPLGVWPTAAELDTFLFARGGVPWRCYPNGTMSSPGLFSGYAFDTIGTRGLPNVTIPLSELRRYQHVVWITDALGASYQNAPTNRTDPTTALRWMSASGRQNTLAQYAVGGGRLWVLGGGGALASSYPWNRPGNDSPTITFSSLTPQSDLSPGMMMYDTEAWRSEFRVATLPATLSRYRGRFEGGPTYAALPAALAYRTSGTDPLPPFRTASQYYRTVAPVEFLQRANSIVEGDVIDSTSTLDTLMIATGGGLPFDNPHNVVMTVYHGPRVPQGTVFTGFDLWTFRRPECRQIVDFVFQNLWGLSPAPQPMVRAQAASRAPIRSPDRRTLRR